MKKPILLLILAVCMLFSGCSNAFAKDEFDNNEKIASADRYAAEVLKRTEVNGDTTLSISKFNGRYTVWTYKATEDVTVAVSVSVGMAKGTAKVVHVGGSGEVTQLVAYENAVGNAKSPSTADTIVKFTKGENRIKLVGYDCEDVEMSFAFVDEE